MYNTNALLNKFTVARLEKATEEQLHVLDMYSVASEGYEGWNGTLQNAALTELGWDEEEMVEAYEEGFNEFEYRVLEGLLDSLNCRVVTVGSEDEADVYIVSARSATPLAEAGITDIQ